MDSFTVFVTEANGRGTVHISAHAARSPEGAAKAGLKQTAADWGCRGTRDLRVLGIAKGDIEIIEWNDLDA